MKELLIMAKSLGGGGSEVALIELINALPEEHYNVTLVLLDLDSEYAYRLKKRVNIVQLTFNSSFAKSLVSMYAFPAKVLKKLSVNYYIPYYDFIANRVTNVFEKTYDIAIDFYGYGSFVTAFLATKIQARKKATWLHDEKLYWIKSVQKYIDKYDKVYEQQRRGRTDAHRRHPGGSVTWLVGPGRAARISFSFGQVLGSLGKHIKCFPARAESTKN